MRCKDQNKVTTTKHVWNLAQPMSPSLWVKQVKEVHLKNKSFWEAKVSNGCSWAWTKILKLKEDIQIDI